jgi:hypothetical protein
MSITTASADALVTGTASRGPIGAVRERLRNAWPLIGIGVAVAVNAAWLCLLGYGLFQLF